MRTLKLKKGAVFWEPQNLRRFLLHVKSKGGLGVGTHLRFSLVGDMRREDEVEWDARRCKEGHTFSASYLVWGRVRADINISCSIEGMERGDEELS